jgi:hypothetical protein
VLCRPARLDATRTQPQELLMNPLIHRSFALFPALLALAACATQTPEPARPAPDDAVADPVATTSAPLAAPPVLTAPTPDPGASPSGNASLAISQDACKSDADCIPAACCHAAACTARDKAPSCAGLMCSQVCQPGTIDCGGGCLCHAGHCAARLESNGRK